VAAYRFPEFLASLENTKYPFVASATLSNKVVSFLEGTFLDAHIYPIDGVGRYYVSRVDVASSQVTVYVGDARVPLRSSATIAIPTTDSVVRLIDAVGRPSGMLLSEPTRLAVLAGWGEGSYVFESAQTEFAATCCVPIPDPGVTSVRVDSGDTASGRVWLVGENGVILDSVQKTTADGRVYEIVRVNVVGDPLYLQTLCEPESAFTPANPLRAIRVIADGFDHTCYPDTRGNFHLQANDALSLRPALRVRTTPDGLIVRVEGSALT
jgi:hypothetical protein